jgi:hypothetical protein
MVEKQCPSPPQRVRKVSCLLLLYLESCNTCEYTANSIRRDVAHDELYNVSFNEMMQTVQQPHRLLVFREIDSVATID